MSKNRDLANYGTAALEDASVSATGDSVVKRDASGNVSAVDVYASGNVGVGTSSPQRNLTINATLPILQLTNPTTGTTGDDGLLIYQNGVNTVFSNQEAGSQVFETAGTERVRIDSSGNVGVATSSPNANANQTTLTLNNGTWGGRLDLNQGANKFGSLQWTAQLYGGNGLDINGQDSIGFSVNNSRRAIIDSSGNVGIGTGSPSAKLHVEESGIGKSLIFSNTNGDVSSANKFGLTIREGGADKIYLRYRRDGSGISELFQVNNAALAIGTSNTERMRIDSSGRLLVGTTSAYVGGNSFFTQGGSGQPSLSLFKNAASSSSEQVLCVLNGLNGGTVSFQVLASGNVQNTNNSYGAISDAKLKENIEPASPKLDKLMQVDIVNYNLIGSELKQIGVVAQQLEEVFPSMVDESEDYEEVETTTVDEDGNETTEKTQVATGTKTKSVKYSVFVPILIKAMQEQQEIIKALEARIEALES